MSNNTKSINQLDIADLIRKQMKIIKIAGTRKEVTISLPKVSNVDLDVVKSLLAKELGYEPNIILSQELTINNMTILLVTVSV